MDLSSRIRSYIDGEEAERLLRKYYGGSYTGSLYDELSSAPDRITSEDIAAVALLSVELSGSAVKALLWTHADAITQRLAKIPSIPLHEVTSETELEPLWDLQEYFSSYVTGVGIGHVRRSKLLAHKRPHLIPIRDRYVLQALVGSTNAPLTLPLRQALQSDLGIAARLQELAASVGLPKLSVLRTLDVIVWMAEVGDGQVPD